MDFRFPEKVQPLFDQIIHPELRLPYAVLVGGRGSGKSESVGRYCIIRAMQSQTLILCARESQNSLTDSVHALLSDIIKSHNLEHIFTIERDKIFNKLNGSKFIFKGMRQDAGHLRSMTGVDIVWIEEAQYIGRAGFTSLDDTIRKDGSQIIMVLNPRYSDDPIYADFVSIPRNDTLKININIMDNKFATDVSRAKARRMMENNYDEYLHVYCGELKEASDALIFKGKYEVREFPEPPRGTIFYHGADWGFSQDPNAIIRAFKDGENLCVDYSVFGYQTEIEELPKLFNQIPGIKYHEVRADNARPETISFMQSKGFNVVPCDKGKGSVEDGIERLRGFNKIVIHPRCVDLIDEFRNYSYKIDQHRIDPKTGREKITTVIRDDYNHGIDALRYATEGLVHVDTLSEFAEAFKNY